MDTYKAINLENSVMHTVFMTFCIVIHICLHCHTSKRLQKILQGHTFDVSLQSQACFQSISNTNFETSFARTISDSILPYFVVKLVLRLDIVQLFGKFYISLLFPFIILSSLPPSPPPFHLHQRLTCNTIELHAKKLSSFQLSMNTVIQ